MDFIYRNTTQLFFTKELIEELNDFIKSNKFKRALIITGETATSKIASTICSELIVEHKIMSGVRSNPLSETVEKIARDAKQFNPDVILTVGGGSVHDTGKAVAIMYFDNNNSVEDYTVTGKFSVPGIKKVLPVITIPTLFGSGAEVSPAALIRIGNEKRVIYSPLLHPLASFINTNLTQSLNKVEISRSAFDSFIQALEGFVSLSSNNISDAFAKTTIEYYNICLPNLIQGIYTEDMLEKLAIASIFSSYVCSTSSVGAIHAISDPISGRFNVHHGTALAMVTLDVLEKNLYAVRKNKIYELDSMLFNLSSEKADVTERVIEKISIMIDKLELLQSVTPAKISEQTISFMVQESFNGDMVGNPYNFSANEIKFILGRWYET